MFTYTRKKPTGGHETIEIPIEVESRGPGAIEAYADADAKGRSAQLAAFRADDAAAREAAEKRALEATDASSEPAATGRRKRDAASPSQE